MARSLRLLDNSTGIVEVTSRTIQGRFLTRPSAKANELILGVLGRAQAKYPVEVFAFVFMSNHFHILMRAESAKRMADFIGFLKANIAKELGRMHGWKGTFWEGRYHSAPLDDDDLELNLERRFRYIVSNGCKEDLVTSPLDWPGAHSTAALYRGESSLSGIWYDRTAEYEAGNAGGRNLFPNVETVRLSPLPFLEGLSDEEQRAYVIRVVDEIAEETRERHEANGTRPAGARRIERRHPHDKPDDLEPSPAPWFHCVSRERYLELRASRAITIAAYREAAERLREGDENVRFPEGTFPPPAPFVGTRAPP